MTAGGENVIEYEFVNDEYDLVNDELKTEEIPLTQMVNIFFWYFIIVFSKYCSIPYYINNIFVTHTFRDYFMISINHKTYFIIYFRIHKRLTVQHLK